MATKQEVLDRLGHNVTGTIAVTWTTKQTLEQYLEIEGESEDIDLEQFLEYVKANTAELIDEYLTEGGQLYLQEMVFTYGNDGELVLGE